MTLPLGESEITAGLWPRVRARVRPAQPWELPAGLEVRDERMVEFWTETPKGLRVVHATGWYSPLRTPELLGKFLEAFGGERAPRESKVHQFYAHYGPLQDSVPVAEGQQEPAWTQRLDPEQRKRLSDQARRGLCEPLWWVRERVLELRLSYELYVALKERRLSSLRALLGDLQQDKAIIGIHMLAGRIVRDVVDRQARGKRKAGSFSFEQHPVQPPARRVGLRRLSEEECLHWGQLLLAGQLNAAEACSWRQWVRQGDLLAQVYGAGEPWGRPAGSGLGLVRTRRFAGLTTAMYLQLAQMAVGGAVMRQCAGCQSLFYPARSDQIYCEARCGDATRQRGYYAQRTKGAKPPSGAEGGGR